ncbi:hypothetical protein TSOC_006405 [Tetrabaena socialis]|uniref:Uncharacterized protein n=1 Tax=Tetrabaena socialis TaxID=47790 RepID=A0A2J8A3R8_9CHLO|nr:hypothetical protein TSOC_006405 [Tetrabaena socialis]|eukprot:PNH07148.1 hypothetical protein TSOC_006405 [Tetrabaena socialis]
MEGYDPYTMEYNVLRERACDPLGAGPSVEEMRNWVHGLQSRRSTGRRSMASGESVEDRSSAFRTLECIQKVKMALTSEGEDDSISARTFAMLTGVSLLAVVVIVLVWELYLRPRESGGMLPPL